MGSADWGLLASACVSEHKRMFRTFVQCVITFALQKLGRVLQRLTRVSHIR